MARNAGSKRLQRAGRKLSAPAQSVMRAFRSTKAAAPNFMSSCGIFPEVSECASHELFDIVNDVATRRLNKGRHLRNLNKQLKKLAARTRRGSAGEIVDQISNDVTALLACEATAAYLFGLSVGLTVRSLPEQLEP